MSRNRHSPGSLEDRLLARPRRTVGVDSHRWPVRLGELDSQGYLVGYIDEDGLAWESLRERIIAVHGQRLAEAMSLSYDNPERDLLMDEVLAEVPDELLADAAREAAGHLAIKRLHRRPPDSDAG